MQKQTLITILIGSILAVCGCASKATDEQLEKMCQHYIEIKRSVDLAPLDERIKKIEEKFKAKADLLKSQEERDVKGWEDALKVQLEEVDKPDTDTEAEPRTEEEKEEERKKLKADFEKKKIDTQTQYSKDIKKLKPLKESELRGANVKFKESQEKAKNILQQCMEKARKKELSQETVTCRINAPDIAAFKACE